MEFKQNCHELKRTLHFDIKEYLNWSLWMNWETHEIGRHTSVRVYVNIFLGKGCKAFIDGLRPLTVENTYPKLRKLSCPSSYWSTAVGEGASCACLQLTGEKVPSGSRWSSLCPYPHAAHGRTGRRKQQTVPELPVSAFQFMPVSGLTEARPFLFNLNLWLFSRYQSLQYQAP